MDEQHELNLRRKALRLTLRGLPPRLILRQIPRSRPWLLKWQKRYLHFGWAGLRSRSRRPHRSPQAYSPAARQLVLRARHMLEQREIGLIGPSAIRSELRRWFPHGPLPANATIKRILREAGVSVRPTAPTRACYFPQPTPSKH